MTSSSRSPAARPTVCDFVPAAIAAGAVAIVAERPPPAPLPGDVAFVRVGNARRALALIAAKIYPRQPRVIAAVTGTSGKTSVAAFTRQIWSALGHRAASIGTIGIVSPSGEIYGSLTTPDPVALHRSLDALAGDGVTHLAIEASSHGLDQYRLDGLRIAAAGFTNITRDHLDYHPTFEAYFAAKLRLFEELARAGRCSGDRCRSRSCRCGDGGGQRARPVDHERRTQGNGNSSRSIRDRRFRADGCGSNTRENISRCACRWSANFRSRTRWSPPGLPSRPAAIAGSVFAALEQLSGAKGRLERVGASRGAQIFVDYAHKPDALAKALDALRPYATGRLVVVFGAGGDRDRGKRPLMGAVAVAKADRVIVTDDNPRSEDAAAIRAAIIAAARGAVEIGDRREAIRRAIADLRSGDVLLIAGKGHETGQIIGDRVIPFSDHEAVATALKELAA